MMSNYTGVAYPATVNAGTSSGFGGNGDALWIFALLVLFGGGGFGGVGNKGAAEVTGYQLGELSGRVADKDSIQVLQNSTNLGFAGLNTAISNGFSSTTFEIVNRLGALSTQVSECCCAVQRQMSEGFGQMRYDMAQGFAHLEAKLDAQTINAQNDRIRSLELQSAMCGVVRYPNQQTYNAGCYPPCGC